MYICVLKQYCHRKSFSEAGTSAGPDTDGYCQGYDKPDTLGQETDSDKGLARCRKNYTPEAVHKTQLPCRKQGSPVLQS